MRPLIIIVDCSTGEETIREMNDQEFAQYEIDIANSLENQIDPQAE